MSIKRQKGHVVASVGRLSPRTTPSWLGGVWKISPLLENKSRGLTAVLLAILVIAVYLPVVHNDFIDYDDPQFITDNQQVTQGLTVAGLKYALFGADDGYVHPIPTLSFMFDASCAGINSAWFHSVNLGIHACNVVLLFLLLSYFTENLLGAALTASLFAVHPLNVESVAWVTERKGLLNALFFLGALLLYAKFARTRGLYYLGASLLAFALSLLCKPMSVTLPLVALLLDFWPLRRFDPPTDRTVLGFAQRAWPLITEKAPYFCLALAFSMLTLATESSIGNVGAVPMPSGVLRLPAVASSYLSYLGAVLVPMHLIPFYPPQPLAHAGAKLALAVGLLAVTVAGFRRFPPLAVGACWFLVVLLPVSNLVSHGLAAMADRYTYLSAIGLFMGASYAACGLIGLAKRAVCCALILAVIVCAILTSGQIPRWHDSVTLFSYTLKVSSNNYIALNNLAWELMKTNAPGQKLDPTLVGMAEEAARLTGLTNSYVLDTLYTACLESGEPLKADRVLGQEMSLALDRKQSRRYLELTRAREKLWAEHNGHTQP